LQDGSTKQYEMHALKLVVAQTMAFDNLNGPTTESMCSTYRSLFTENTP